MKTILSIRTTLPALLAVALLATACDPAQAEEKREPIEKFRATATSVDLGAVRNLDIVIYEWTTLEERKGLLKSFVVGGSKALYDALGAQGEKGYLKLPQTLGYDMKYAFQYEVEGKRRIVLATDRPMSFLEVASNTGSTDYSVSLVVLELDPETGEGEGSAIGGAELSIDRATSRMAIEFPGTRQTKLTNVKKLAPKKKGE